MFIKHKSNLGVGAKDQKKEIKKKKRGYILTVKI